MNLTSFQYKRRLQRNITITYINAFLHGFIFIVPIWVAFQLRIMDFTQIALLAALESMIVILLELPTGALADLIGRKKTILLGCLIIVGSYFVFAFAPNLLIFTIGVVMLATGDAFVSGADSALFYDTLKELGQEDRFPKIMAKAGFIHRIGLTIAVFAGGYMYAYWFRLPYVAMAIIYLAALGFTTLMIEPRIDSEKFTLKSYLHQTKTGFRELFKTPHIRKLSAFYVLVGGITWSCLYYFNVPFATDVGFSEIEIGWVMSLVFFSTSTLILYLSSNQHLFNRKVILLGFPIVMIISLLPGYLASKTIAVIMLFGVQLAGSSRFTFLDQYTNQEFASKYRATAVSSLNMLVGIFFTVIVGLSGMVQDSFGTKPILTVLGLFSLLLILPLSINLLKEHPSFNP